MKFLREVAPFLLLMVTMLMLLVAMDAQADGFGVCQTRYLDGSDGMEICASGYLDGIKQACTSKHVSRDMRMADRTWRAAKNIGWERNHFVQVYNLGLNAGYHYTTRLRRNQSNIYQFCADNNEYYYSMFDR